MTIMARSVGGKNITCWSEVSNFNLEVLLVGYKR